MYNTSEQSDLECPPVSFIFSCKGLSFIWPSLSLQLFLHSWVSRDPVSQRASDGSDQFLWPSYEPYYFETIYRFYLFIYSFYNDKALQKCHENVGLVLAVRLLKQCDSFPWESDQNVSYLLKALASNLTFFDTLRREVKKKIIINHPSGQNASGKCSPEWLFRNRSHSFLIQTWFIESHGLRRLIVHKV